jgi:hypothetical protein
MLVSLAITLVVTGAMLGLIHPVHGMVAAQPDAADMQQRVRVVEDAIGRDLMMAAAGTRGSFASVLPHRRGAASPDPPGTFFDDRVSVLHIPARAPETTVLGPTGGGSVVLVQPQLGCSQSDPLCGFHPNMLVAIFDESGAYDTVRLTAVISDPPALLHEGSVLSKSYATGARVAQVRAATYWLQQPSVSTGVPQLRKYDGDKTDLPVADNVIDLRFEYFADAEPSGAFSSPVAMTPQSFTDGPWKPDSSAANRFDVDLLRIRRIRVSLRVRSSRAFLAAPRPDQQIRIDVAPRNLNLLQ